MKLRTLLLASGAALAAAAPAANLFAVGNGWNDSSSNFYRIDDYDTATPVAVNIGETGLFLGDIAFDHTTNKFFAVSLGASPKLYEINGNTGAATLIGSTSGMNALEVDLDGTLYGMASSTLFTINKGTGAATAVGAGSHTSSGDLAVDTDGTMYLTTTQNKLVKVNKSTGATTEVGSIDPQMFGLEIDTDGQMYGGTSNTNNGLSFLYQLDKSDASTQNAAVLNLVSGHGLYGLTFDAEPVPEPSAILALGLGAVALLRRQRTR